MMDVASLIEAARHVYGAKCERPNCVWCREWVKVKAQIEAEDAAIDQAIGSVIGALKPDARTVPK